MSTDCLVAAMDVLCASARMHDPDDVVQYYPPYRRILLYLDVHIIINFAHGRGDRHKIRSLPAT